ncbi:MAG: glycoside hydrolase family 25 protein [Oscillospiraceae bacterium]
MPEFKGIDVSSWQGNINWADVKRDGVQFAMLRVGAGLNADRMFKRNIEGANAEGINCGVYLYSLARTANEALAEANFTLNAVKPYSLTLPIAFDIEDKAQHALTNAQRTDLVQTYCGAIANSGYLPMVYASLSWFNTMLDLSRIASTEKWVAQWGQSCTFKSPYTMWQYSNKGRVNGINGDVDLNISYRNYAGTKPDDIPLPPPIIVAPKAPFAGQKLALSQVALYATATMKLPIKKLIGSYWCYDGIAINGRIRITNSPVNVKKTPIGKYVTGYISLRDIGT